MIELAVAVMLAGLTPDPLIPGAPAVLRGHTDTVVAVAFSPDGKRVASGSRDKTVRLWSLETGEALAVIPGAKQQPVALAFSRDGTRLAVGDSAFEVRIIDVATGAVQATFLHPDSISQVAFDASGERLFVTGFNGNAGLYGLTDGKQQLELRGTSVVVLAGGKEVLLSSPEQAVRTVDLKSGKTKKEFPTSPHQPFLLGSLDGTVLASFSPRERDVRVYDRKTGRVASTLKGPTPDLTVPERALSADVESAALTPDGKRLVTSAADRVLRVWDVATGQLVTTFPVLQRAAVAVSPDGRLVAAADTGLVKVFTVP